jgi:CheY-like chemotaxis protein
VTAPDDSRRQPLDSSDALDVIPDPGAAAAGGVTVLLVEDEGAVRSVARRILQRAGFHVLEATNGAEGLQVWGRHAAEIGLVVTDVVMPGMGGRALVERLLADRPGLPVVFMSGYADGALDVMESRAPHVCVLAKPFSPGGLLRRVGEAIAVS